MTLGPGSRIGLYEVASPLGAGGMGEVYRARDTRLGRDVALKILPESFAADPDRLARFEREALMLAALNHPNISALYGIEESTDVHALVLELVDGATLADRLEQGPIAIDEALAIARQVCDALAAAHEHGIIHRDLKPANVKLRADGVVKVLDFGLAKLAEPSRAAAETVEVAPADRTTGAITGVGIIMGTAAYMSPEQAKGQEADKRSDVWAFGCLLFEMLTAKRPFGGSSITEVLGAVLHTEPDWRALPQRTPVSIRRLLRRCLQKDPRKRLHDIADARLDLDEAAEPAAGEDGRASSPAPRAWKPVAWAAIAVAIGLAALASWAIAARRTDAHPVQTMRLALDLPASTTINFFRGSAVALSPDGATIAYTAEADGTARLYVQPLNSGRSEILAGTDGAANPFFSPDAQWIGFFADGKIKKVRVTGGAPTAIGDAVNPRGEAWGSDGYIYFTPKNNGSVMRVSESGATAPEPVSRLEAGEFSHRWPQVLPGAKAMLFSIWNDTGFEDARIAVQPLPSGPHRIVVAGGGYPRYIADGNGHGYLIYAQSDGIMATPFDAERLEVTGPATRVIDDVITNLSGGAHISIAGDGIVAYAPGTLGEIDRELVWIDRAGKTQPAARVRGMSPSFRLSPDGHRMIHQNVGSRSHDTWIEELDRGTTTRFTFNSYNYGGVWSSDGKNIAYSSGRVLNLYRKRADGVGDEERLLTSPNGQIPSSWSPDGRTVIYTENDPVTGFDIWTVDVETKKAKVFLKTPFNESVGTVSPDGKWLAYQGNESGRFQVYVTPFPGGGRKYQISTDGGFSPAWSHSGKELFYRTNRTMMSAAVTTEPEFVADRPRQMFEGRFEGDTNVSPDDQRFLVIRSLPQETTATHLKIIVNWFDELKKLLAR